MRPRYEIEYDAQVTIQFKGDNDIRSIVEPDIQMDKMLRLILEVLLDIRDKLDEPTAQERLRGQGAFV